MIAAGLCMMGGCFAQDATTRAVEAYWPAHSVRVERKSLIIKEESDDLLLPFWTEGMKAGGRLENVFPDSDGNILNWGHWTNAPYYSQDALYFGCSTTGPCGYMIFIKEGKVFQRMDFSSTESGPPYEWTEISVSHDSGVFFSTPSQTQTFPFPPVPSPYYSPWRIRVTAAPCKYVDVVSYWWMNDVVQKQYFMVQPMCSVAGESAFFTHGFNILTEL